MDFSTRMPSSSDYVHALEEERKKIQVFQRELPLCLQLVTRAIETVRKQMGVDAAAEAATASDDVPVLEEFIPLKPSSYSSSSDEDRSGVNGDTGRGAAATRKPDWLKSVQLWSQDAADAAAAMVAVPTKPIAVNAKRMAGAFHPFEREKRVAAPAVSAAAASSSASGGAGGTGGGGGGGEEKEKEGQSQLAHRKVRRNWSPELHRRFMEALERLGGSHVATPKQIREVMKVDGLTNDEVKSHLQKYRLHSRRPCTTTTALVQTSINSSSTPIPQFVVVGGIWVPPPTAAGPPVDGIPPPLAGGGAMFAPATSMSPSQLRSYQQQAEKKQKQSNCTAAGEETQTNGDNDDDASPATSSSSSQTTTASHLHTSS